MKIPFINIKNTFCTIACLLVLLSGMSELRATHIVGGNLTYKHLAGDNYEINFTFRRDCFNAAFDASFDDPIRIAIYTKEGKLATWIGDFGVLEIPLSSSDTLNTTILSDCGFIGQQVCVEETKYIKNLRLPFRLGGYVLSYQRCCRNITLNNVIEPLNTGGTYTVCISEEAMENNNNSPNFNQWPDIYICANEPINFDHSATDLDGDSLVYSLCAPYSGASEANPNPLAPAPPYDTVVWQAPYSTHDPLGGVPLQIDPATGILTGTPNLVGQFLVGICVKEYRNGELLSEIRRDFQYNVRVCSEAPEIAFSVEEVVCNYTPVFINESEGVDSYKWYYDNGDGNKVEFSSDSIPDFQFPEAGIYTITLEGFRSIDGCMTSYTATVEIPDSDLTADFQITLSSCLTNSFAISIKDLSLDNSESENTIVERTWSINTDGEIQILNGDEIAFESQSGEGSISLHVTAANGCTAEVERDFTIEDLIPDADFSTIALSCHDNGTVVLSLTDATNTDQSIISYDWKVSISGENQNFAGPSVEVTVNDSDVLDIQYTITFENGCVSLISNQIVVSDLISDAGFEVSIDECNDDGSLDLLLISNSSDIASAAHLWTVKINGTSTQYNEGEVSILNVDENAEVEVTLALSLASGCDATSMQSFNISDLLPLAEFSATVSKCNEDGTVDILLSNTSDNLDNLISSNWEILFADGSKINFTGNEIDLASLEIGSDLSITLTNDFNNSCSSSITRSIALSDILPVADFTTQITSCNEDGTVDVELTNNTNDAGSITSEDWVITYGTEEITSATSPVTLAGLQPDQILNVSLTVTNNVGCTSSKDREINLSDIIPAAEFDVTLAACNEDGSFTIHLTDVSGSSGDVSFAVNVNGNITTYTTSPVALTVNEGDQITVVQNLAFDNGCVSEKEETINLEDIIPNIDISGSVTSCNADGSLNLSLTADANGNLSSTEWTLVVDGMTSTFTGNEISIDNVAAASTIEISLEGTFDNGCTASKSENFITSDFLPKADFVLSISSCNDDGTVDVLLTDATENAADISAIDWSISSNGVVSTYTGSEVSLTGLALADIIEVTQSVTSISNCQTTVTKSVSVSDLLPNIDIAINVTNCNEDGSVDVELTNNTNDAGSITSEDWVITYGTEEITSATSPVTLAGLQPDQILNVSLTVTNNVGCTSSKDREINLSDIIPAAEFDVTLAACNEDGSFTIHLTDVSGSSGDVSFEVNVNGNITTYTTSPVALTVNEGDQITVVQNLAFDNGCVSEKEETINLEDLFPVPSFTIDVTSCNTDGTIDLNLINTTPGLEPSSIISWTLTVNGIESTSNGDEAEIPNLNLEDIISVILEIQLTNGCNARIDSTLHLESLLPKAAYNTELIGCQAEDMLDVRLVNTTSTTIQSAAWEITNGEIKFTSIQDSVDITIDRTIPTIITLNVEFENGCTDVLVDTLDLNNLLPTPTFDFKIEECIEGDLANITLTENTLIDQNKVAYEWIVRSNNQTFNGAEEAISLTIHKDSVVVVSLRVTLDNGCVLVLEDLEFLPGPLFPNVEFAADRIIGCIGDTVSLVTNPNSDWTYTWEPTNGLIFNGTDDHSRPQVIISGVDQLYHVTVTDGVCEDSSSVVVGVDSSTIMVFSGDSSSCDGTFTVIALPSDGIGSIEWASDREFTNILSTSDTLKGEQNRTTTYYARVVGGSCSNTLDSVSIKSAEIDIFEIPFEICQGDTTDLTIVNLDLEQELSFIFEPNSHIVDRANTGMPIIGIGQSELDSFYLYYMVSNQFGCTNEDSVLVRIVDNPMIDFMATIEECGAYTVCFDITMDFNGFPLWEFGDPASGNDNRAFIDSPCHTYPGPGDYTVKLSTLSNFCAAEPIEKTITLTEDFSIVPIGNQVACIGDTLHFFASTSVAGLDYVWCDVSGDTLGLGDTLTYIPLSGGNTDIILKGFDYFKCSDSTMFRIEVIEFDLTYDIPSLICNGDETMVSVTSNDGSNYQYTWSPASAIVSGGNTSSPTISIDENTEIVLSILDVDSGCTFDTSFSLLASGIDAEITADPGIEINLGESVDLEVLTDGNPVDYEWSIPGVSGPEVTDSPSSTTTYTVTVTDDNGCTDVASITITVRQPACDETDVYIPNAFTPNNDGNNDVFRVRSNFIESMTLIVYNRWGEEIFSTTDPDEGWDGTFENEALSSDVYGFYLEVICINNIQYNIKGNVSLLR